MITFENDLGWRRFFSSLCFIVLCYHLNSLNCLETRVNLDLCSHAWMDEVWSVALCCVLQPDVQQKYNDTLRGSISQHL